MFAALLQDALGVAALCQEAADAGHSGEKLQKNLLPRDFSAAIIIAQPRLHASCAALGAAGALVNPF